MNSISPQRTYYFSDTFGGGSSDPLDVPDADALISTDFRSRPTERVHREFDIYGRERVTDHILRLICRLHDEMEHCLVDTGATGILINCAPRTQTFRQGEPFHLAELIGGKIRIVAPLNALRPVKKHVEKLHRLPNKDNGLFPENEQFRSSFVGRLLENDHGIGLKDADPSKIRPDHVAWVVEYVDRFGNIVTQDNRKNSPKSAFDLVPSFRLKIGNVVHDITAASGLNAAPPGRISVYRNDGYVEVVRKWISRETQDDARRRSAYVQFGKPRIGTSVCVVNSSSSRPIETEHELLDGQKIPTLNLQDEDKRYLEYLSDRISKGELYLELLHWVRSLGAFPLKGSIYITDEIRNSPVFRIADDLVARAGIDQGFLLPPEGQ